MVGRCGLLHLQKEYLAILVQAQKLDALEKNSDSRTQLKLKQRTLRNSTYKVFDIVNETIRAKSKDKRQYRRVYDTMSY